MYAFWKLSIRILGPSRMLLFVSSLWALQQMSPKAQFELPRLIRVGFSFWCYFLTNFNQTIKLHKVNVAIIQPTHQQSSFEFSPTCKSMSLHIRVCLATGVFKNLLLNSLVKYLDFYWVLTNFQKGESCLFVFMVFIHFSVRFWQFK